MKSLSNNSDNELVMSPSMRREWIEISFAVNYGKTWEVSLHAEGVD